LAIFAIEEKILYNLINYSFGKYMKKGKIVKRIHSGVMLGFLLFFSFFLAYDQYNGLKEVDFLRGSQSFEALDVDLSLADEIKVYSASNPPASPLGGFSLANNSLSSIFFKIPSLEPLAVLRC
jgi:hypothetical protein